ncbi:CDK5 regulatory subunit-associated protein 2-like [Homarus americanus]|uniref:CDK5 regulatory subunit-associated protein 2-like n=1 Tax=Homarus americanus TaxID=6706 RepID=A0A8J5KDH5_HOMAM|nr:CDK5 regulatory subunit-associated protein 2-like [Homarus americanus]
MQLCVYEAEVRGAFKVGLYFVRWVFTSSGGSLLLQVGLYFVGWVFTSSGGSLLRQVDLYFVSGSPAQVQDANSLDSSGSSSIPFSLGLRSPGKVSPLRGRTMKEYEEQLGNLKKENFSLKLRIYFLEERMDQKYDKEDKDELYKTNIELKVETEALKQELYDKQELVRQASTALSGLEQQFQEQVAQMKDQHEQEKEKLHTHVEQLQKEVDDHVHRFREERGRLGELSQLCGLAFSTEEEIPETLQVVPPSKDNLSLPLNLAGFNNFATKSPVQGLFSMPTTMSQTAALEQCRPEATTDVQPAQESAEEKVSSLKARVVELESRVTELEGELAAKEETTCILEGDIANLQKEVKEGLLWLEDKVEKIADLEVEVTEKDLKIDDVMQELETRHIEMQAKDDQIQSLHYDLNKVEPEIEVKVQEIIERDRIIEEKIEQIEQQNKILVEIQITLDEKQKQIADMEHKITESSEKIKKLTEDLDKSCKVIQTFAEEVQARDKEIAALRKEVKRKEKKIRDLVAELKEALDMLNKAKWEAETSGGEDGVKEMAEEENERLWAELESRKNEVLAIRAEHKHSLSEAEERVNRLQKQLDEKIKVLEGQQGKHDKETEERELRLREQAQQVAHLEGELEALRGDMSSREGLLRTNQGLVQGLEEELTAAKDQLKEKRAELDILQEELKKKNADMQDLVNRELWERNREVERLQEKLGALTSDRRQQIECLKDELETKNSELRRLKSRLNCDNTENVDGNKAAVCPPPTASQPAVNTLTTDQPKNAAHLTVVTGSGGADAVTVNRPLHLTFTDDSSASVQMLYLEMSKVRSEAQALRLERSMLNDKLSSLQGLYDQVCQTNTPVTTIELHEQMGSVKKQLEETKEENLLKERKHGEIVNDFQSQVQVLRTELNNAKKKINQQLTEVTVRKYQEALKRHKQEIASLRKRLADSHNACDLLRTRLEELADFLERILEMEEKGLINLSQLSPKQLASLHKTLNESRALSRSLSQSLMIGMDFTDHGDDTHLSGSMSSVSSWSLQRDDSLSETHDYLGASSHEAIASLPDETMLQPEDSHDPAVQALATQLNTQIDQKAREIDAIAENVSVLSEKLAERTQQVEQQAGVIGELRGQVGRLQDEVRHRDLQLLESRAEQNKDNGQQALHSSWQSSLNPLAASSQSTVHAMSPQTTVHTHDSSSQESLHKSAGNCSDTLPPPPLHLLQDSECEVRPDIRELEICHASDRSSLSAVKSAYSTDAAIKAYSGHLGYFQQHVTPGEKTRVEGRKPWGENTNGAAGSCVVPEQPWQPVSPSESEAWSEPDRNVSLARIGLDACTLGGAPDRALSRSRQQRTSAAITSESDGEAAHEDTATCTANTAPTQGKVSKRRSDVAELRKVSTKLRAVEQLNDTLRAELNIYQTLSQQMGHEPQDQQQRPMTSDKSVETHKGETVDASVGAEEVPALPPPPPTFAIPAPLLDEIRALRLKLEEAIANNDHLRDQLEAALTAHPQDEARFYHLTAALQTAQEEMREARDRLQGSQEAVREQQEKYSKIELKLQECEGHLAHCQVQLEASQTEASAAKADLCKAHQLLQEKESLIKERDAQLAEKEQSIRELVDKSDQLEKDAANNPDNDEQLQKLQLELQKQESRLLQVNKERLSLVGERACLQAQLASASTHARLLQDVEGAGEEHISVLQQLEAERATVVTLQQERKQLLTDKEHFEKEMQVLQEEVASLRARVEHLMSRQAHVAQQADSEKKNTRELRNEHTALQRDHSELQCKAQNFEVELRNLREKQKTSEDSQQCISEQTTLVKQLTAELESERCLTSNLQLQLEVVRGSTSPTTSQCDDSVVPHASDSRASHESVTSIEFFHPLPDPSVLWKGRETSLSPSSRVDKEKGRERRASSSSRRRDGSKRMSSHRSEDKENLHCTTTTVTTAGNSSKRNRRSHSGNSGEGVFAAQPLVPEEEGDGGTTSGESPDLGIGSDYHFSSLERGTRTLRSIVHTARDLPPPPLCSQPSHSVLSVENQQLRMERDNLSSKLASTKETLEEALEKLSKANQRKENVERAICKQLYKTHNVLKKAKTHLKQANSLPQ